MSKKIILVKPIGFLDFLNLEINSKFLITDSGTVQEEASILGKKCLIFRDSTERLETIEQGNAIIINKKIKDIKKIKMMLIQPVIANEIKEYTVPNVSQIVSNIINSDIKI